jgi:tetratricopeptide (TPR) repeat protein
VSDLKNRGEDHPSVATRRSNLAVVLKDLGELPRARELLEKALASDLKNLGEDHPSAVTRRYNLAVTLELQADSAGALALLGQVLRAQEKRLGADHPSRAVTRAKIASLLFQSGETDRACQEAREALRTVANQPPGSTFRTNVERLTAGIC